MLKAWDNETKCPNCRQLVPINTDGKIVRHYSPIRNTPVRNRAEKVQSVCAGSGIGAR